MHEKAKGASAAEQQHLRWVKRRGRSKSVRIVNRIENHRRYFQVRESPQISNSRLNKRGIMSVFGYWLRLE